MEWTEVQLGDVLQYEQPTKYLVESSNYIHDKNATPVLTAGKTFLLGFTKERNGIFKNDLPVIIFDDFTTASKLVQFPFKVKSSAIKILHANRNIADIRYLYFVMQTINFKILKHKRHWISEYSKLQIKLPPLTEQRRIVENLEKAFNNIAEALSTLESNINKANLLKQSVTNSIFCSSNFELKKLDDIALINPKKDFGNLDENDEVTFVPMESVNEVTGSISKRETKKLGAVRKGYTSFLERDVIFAKITPCMENGKCAVVRELTNNIGFGSTEFYVIRAKSDIVPEYLWYFLRQESVRKNAKKHFTGAAGHKRVPKNFMENLEVPMPMKNGMPDKLEQQLRVAQLDKVSLLSQELDKLILKQKSLFYSLQPSVLDQNFSHIIL